MPSNRGDIQECDWNYVLRDEVIRAFQLAVFKFITMPRLQYTWLRFLPDGWHSNSFMSTLANAESLITKDLKYRKILWSRAQTLEAPVTLTYVSARFLDRDLNPLMGDHGDYQYQLSPSYAQGDLHALYRLGVREMTPGTFLEKLAKADGRNIRDCRSSSYHVDLAKCLKGIGLSYWSDISRLKLIPLRTGEWVTGSSITSSPIYFEDGEGDFCVPSAIDIRIADPSATQNRARKELFEWLGVKYCSKQEVCTLILKEHRGEFQGFKTLDNLRSHAVYLYKFGKTPMNSRFDHI